MHFSFNDDYPNRIVEGLITHRGETIRWDVSKYWRTKTQDMDRFFNNLNGWLSTFSGTDQAVLFEQFRSIRELFNTHNELTKLHYHLTQQLAIVYERLTFDALKQWIMLNGQLYLPDGLRTSHREGDTQQRINMTYLRDDYMDLLVLSVLLKPLMFVFGQYIIHTEKEVAVWLKEHYAYGLLKNCAFTHTPAFQRLVLYVDTLTDNELRKDKDRNQKNQLRTAVFGGLGTEELPIWLLSRAIVCRVVTHEEQAPISLIEMIYKHVEQGLKGFDKTFKSRVGEKYYYNDSSTEDNTSIIENYKTKQEVSDGDLEILSYYMRGLDALYQRIDPTIDPVKREYCAQFWNSNHLFEIDNSHIVLAQWVLARAITPRSLPLLDKLALINAMIATQSLLWHWGFTELALIMGAEASSESSYTLNSTTPRLSKPHYQTLVDAYPYYREQSKAKSKTTARNTNVAYRAISLLSDQLCMQDWDTRGPEALLEIHGYRETARQHIVSADIRNILGALITKLLELESTQLN